MKAQVFATVLTRILGLYFICEGLVRLSELLAQAWRFKGNAAETDWTSYPPVESVAKAADDLYLDDAYYIVIHGWVFLAPAFKFLIGLVLLVAAKRVARLLCLGVEQP